MDIDVWRETQKSIIRRAGEDEEHAKVEATDTQMQDGGLELGVGTVDEGGTGV